MFKSKRRNLIDAQNFNNLSGKIEELIAKLNGYISYLKKNTVSK